MKIKPYKPVALENTQELTIYIYTTNERNEDGPLIYNFIVDLNLQYNVLIGKLIKSTEWITRSEMN